MYLLGYFWMPGNAVGELQFHIIASRTLLSSTANLLGRNDLNSMVTLNTLTGTTASNQLK